jgi:hypothetical protein
VVRCEIYCIYLLQLNSTSSELNFVFPIIVTAVHDEAEWRTRLRLQFIITRDLIKRHVDRTADSGIQRVVLFGHADPGDNHRRFFRRLRFFIHFGLRNKVPILYLNGDTHAWNYEPNFMNEKSLLRITVPAGGDEVPVRIQVNINNPTSNPEEAFEYERNSYLQE